MTSQRQKPAPPIAKPEEPESMTARVVRLIREDERAKVGARIEVLEKALRIAHHVLGLSGSTAPMIVNGERARGFIGFQYAADVITAALAESADRGEEKANG